MLWYLGGGGNMAEASFTRVLDHHPEVADVIMSIPMQYQQHGLGLSIFSGKPPPTSFARRDLTTLRLNDAKISGHVLACSLTTASAIVDRILD